MAEQVGEIYYTVDMETQRLTEKVKVADKSLDSLENQFKDTDRAASSLQTGLSALSKAIGAVIAASALRDMANMVQSYQEMAERVQMATASQAEFEMVQRRLLETANGTYRSLSEAQELYIRTADALRSMGYSTDELLDVTDSMSYAFVTNATSVERANNAIDALAKSVNKGKVEADAWETIIAAIPTVIDDVARASGRTAAEIRKLGAEGDITAAALTEGLRQSLDETRKAAEDMATNLRDAGVRARTALTSVLVGLEAQTGALQAVTDGIIQASNAILEFGGDSERMAQFLEAAEVAAVSLAAVVAGRLVTSMGQSVASLYAATVGAANKAKADLAAAQASAALAAEQLIVARTAVAVTTGLSTNAAAVQRLAAAEAQATTATATLNAAQQASARIAGVATVAMNGLRGAMALLGGPAGLIFLAATAIYQYATSTEEATPKTDALAASVNRLGTAAERAAERFKALTTGIDGLNKKELGLRKNELENQLANAERQLASFERQFEKGIGTMGQVEGARAAVEELRGALEKLNNTKPAESTAPSAIIPDAPAKKTAKTDAEKQADQIKERVEALQLEADTLGMSATELELYKLQLAGATDEQIRAAASSRAMIDAFEQQQTALEKAEETRKKFGTGLEAEAAIRGDVDPLSGGPFDDQSARFDAEAAAEETRYAEQLERLRQAKEAQVQLSVEYQTLEEQLAKDHADRLMQIEQARTSAMLQNGQQLFDGLAGAAQQFAGEQSALYKVMFAASKAFAIADAAVKIQQGIAAAAANPWPANLAAMASVAAATGSIISSISSVSMGGGRLYGGPVNADSMYRVNENGAPEVFNAANGRQYMLPNQRGEVVSNENATSGGGNGVNVVVNINQSAEKAGTMARTNDGETEMIDIFVADIMGDGRTARAISTKFGVKPVGR